MEMTGYRSCSLEPEPGDTIFVYTDGVTEAENSEKEEFFGMERLTNAAAETGIPSSGERMVRIQDTVHTFASGVSRFDDTTMICIRCQKQPS